MKKGKVIRVENDIVTIGMNNGSIKEVRRCRLLNESNRFSSSSNQTEEQRKIHAEKIQIISSQLPRLIRVDT